MAFRLSWFSPGGRFVRSVPLEPVGEVPPRFVDRFADGSLLLSSSVRIMGNSTQSGTRRDTLLPADFRATHIGADFVLGVWTEGDGVEYVRTYALGR